MEHQFNDLSIPDPTISYAYYYYNMCTKFTHLMKLVLVVNQFPNVLELIEELIEKNPGELDKQNSNGWSALMIASINCSRQSSIECVKLLIKLGADANLHSIYGNTALILASEYCATSSSIECVRLLIEAGANLDAGKRTALMQACERCATCSHVECVDLLIEAGADMNLRSASKMTALMHFCNCCKFNSSNLDTLMVLIRNTDDITSVDTGGKSAYKYYKENVSHIKDEYIEDLLQGKIRLSNTKSARNVTNV